MRSSALRPILPLWTFVLLGCAGLINPAPPPPPEGMVWVVEAVVDIPTGDLLKVGTVRYVLEPQDYVPDEVVRRGADAVGHRARSPIYRGEAIRRERISEASEYTLFDARIAEPSDRGDHADDEMVMVVVAAAGMAAGHAIREEDIYAVEIPPWFLGPNVFLAVEPVVGATVCEALLENEFVRSERIAPAGTGCPPGT